MPYDRDKLIADAQTIVDTLSTLPVPPVTPAIAPDPIVIHDGEAGISGTHLYCEDQPGTQLGGAHGWQPWGNKGGDWLDADGTPQGTKAFTSKRAELGMVGDWTLDVTPLVIADSEPQIVIRAVGSALLVCKARETGQGPKLAVVYADGTSETLPVRCDVGIDPTTGYETGNRVSNQITSTKSLFLRFPAPSKPISTATLVLVLEKVWTAGVFSSFRFALHRAPRPTETFTLKGDSRVHFETVDWTDVKADLDAYVANGFKPLASAPKAYVGEAVFGSSKTGGDPYQQRAIVDTPVGKALELRFDTRINGVISASVLFPDFGEANEAAFEFDARILPEMQYGLTQGFKFFAGFSSSTINDNSFFAQRHGIPPGRVGTLLAGNGGARVDGTDGWSLRSAGEHPYPPEHPLAGRTPPFFYVYHPEQYGDYGDMWAWNQQHMAIPINEWATFGARLKVNSSSGTTFQRDAELDCYINHKLAFRKRGFYLRKTDTPKIALAPYNVDSKLTIGRFWLNTYAGGKLLPRANCAFQTRNLRTAKYA